TPRDLLRRFYYCISGDASREEIAAAFVKGADKALLDGMADPPVFPKWLSDADLDYYVGEFEQSGFFGPLSRYRNHTRDFHYLQQFKDRTLSQPAFIAGGDRDGAFTGFGAMGDPIAVMRSVVPNLESAHVLEG